jgi:hypothetical protein
MRFEKLSAQGLRDLALGASQTPCKHCKALHCPGWDSLPAGFDRADLRQVATLRDEESEHATLLEYHPEGTTGWSENAPIAPTHFPYNRCEVWQCAHCTRLFLRYTEYGGYYVDERIRALNPAWIVDVP